MDRPVIVSEMDKQHYELIRENVRNFMRRIASGYKGTEKILDIAPQDHEGAAFYFPPDAVVHTLDINPAAGCTFTGDLCAYNSQIPDNSYDIVVCTEVLEHTLQPFKAAAELHRFLKPGGLLAASTPYNFRIHGPLPDCWRFTEHGLRALLTDFDTVKIEPLETPDRDLMPIHYTFTASKSIGS